MNPFSSTKRNLNVLSTNRRRWQQDIDIGRVSKRSLRSQHHIHKGRVVRAIPIVR